MEFYSVHGGEFPPPRRCDLSNTTVRIEEAGVLALLADPALAAQLEATAANLRRSLKGEPPPDRKLLSD